MPRRDPDLPASSKTHNLPPDGRPRKADDPADLEQRLHALANVVSHSRLQEGTGRRDATLGLRPLMPKLRRCAKHLSREARRNVAFLCGVAWRDQGPFWARALLGATDYGAAHNIQYTLTRFQTLRRAMAVAEDPAAALADFLALEAAQVPFLPAPYRVLLHGWSTAPGGGARHPVLGNALDRFDPRQAQEAVRVDRLLYRLTAIVEAKGISAQAGRAVAAAMIEPQIFRAASRQQRASFLASALAAGDGATATLLIELTPASTRAELLTLAQHAKAMHWDVGNWLLTNLESKDLVAAHADLRLLTSKPYWGQGMPRYAALDDRRKLVYSIQARMQATSQSARNVAATKAAYNGLMAIRQELIDASTARDGAVLRATSSKAIVETDLPETSLEQAYMGELFGTVGLDPDQGRKYAPSELLIKGLRALAERAGVDADALFETLGRGKKALLALAKNPGKILAFALGAFHGAFGRLKTNFPSIIGKSLLSVITGPKSGIGMQLPTQWNLKSTAGFMMQMAGLGVDRVRKLVVRLAGDRGTAFIERVTGPIMTLFSGKPSTVMASVEGQIGEVKRTAFDTAKTWLLENVVTRSLVKLATMFSPVGAAIAAIQVITNLVTVLGTWGNQIATVVSTFMDSMTMIAEGKVKPAADRIFDAIVGILPAVMSFLVGLVFGGSSLFTKLRAGMAAIGDRIWKIVVSIVTAIVERMKKMFRGKPKRSRNPEVEKRRQQDAFADVRGRLAKLPGRTLKIGGADRRAVKRSSVLRLLERLCSKHDFSVLRLLTPPQRPERIRVSGGFSPEREMEDDAHQDTQGEEGVATYSDEEWQQMFSRLKKRYGSRPIGIEWNLS